MKPDVRKVTMSIGSTQFLSVLVMTCLPVCVMAGGCWAEKEDTATRSFDRAIINGSLDTTNQAVVAYLSNGAVCTATIVAKQGSQGYALTAGHCIGGQLGVLRQGNNRVNGQYDVEYAVVEAVTHPCYQTGQFDLAMLRFSGATVSTPVIPAMSPTEDTLGVGSSLEHVGYGSTESGTTPLRHRTVNIVDDASVFAFVYDISATGPASGDGGGPGLSTAPGGTRVASVISFIIPSTVHGWDMRVSSEYHGFILAFINGTPFSWDDGNPCTTNAIGAGVCTTTFNTDPCDDGVACTENDTCGSGVCQAGTPTPALCPAGGECDHAVCDPQTGCGLENEPDWTPCEGGGDPHACFGGVCDSLAAGDDCDRGITLTLGVEQVGTVAGAQPRTTIPAACVGAGLSGPDVFHQISLIPGEYRVQLTPTTDATADFALAIWSGCMAGDPCLQAANAGGEGQEEVITSVTVSSATTLVIHVMGVDFAGDDTAGEYRLLVQVVSGGELDAGIDGGSPDGSVQDGAVTPDGSTLPPDPGGSGCGCHAPGTGGGWLPLILLVFLLGGRLRWFGL